MAKLLWGKVYFHDQFAGLLRQELGDRMSFIYDKDFLQTGKSVAYTLPLQPAPFIYENGLLPFFDNLVAEGWLEKAQTRLLGKRSASRFELLLAYGHDCAGAVSIIDSEPTHLTDLLLDKSDPKEIAILQSRASLSGIQPKLALVEREGKLFPSQHDEISTHIAKFPSTEHDDLLINEYLTTKAFQALLPEDDVVNLKMDVISGFSQPALITKRFDRSHGQRIHFEEFNQLLNRSSNAKYSGSYKEMAEFLNNTKGCLPAEVYRLFIRILAGILLGNTDMHFKNFALFHTTEGLRLTPSYDQVAAALYQYKTLALTIGGASDLQIGKIKSRTILTLGKEFGLSNKAIEMAVKQLERHLKKAEHAILEEKLGSEDFKNKLITLMRKRWNGTFALIGKALLKKR